MTQEELQRTIKMSRMKQHELYNYAVQLEHEAQWLADKLSLIEGISDRDDGIEDSWSAEQWRDAARKAVNAL